MSTTTTPTRSEAPVLTYARLLYRLHLLIAEGKGDHEEADALRDEMDAPGYALNQKEHARVGGLSEDLYTLVETGVKHVSMSPEERKAWGEGIAGAIRAGDWDGALQLLRRAPSDLPADRILFAQAWCWHRLGDPETALVFVQEAVRRCPSPLLEEDTKVEMEIRAGGEGDQHVWSDLGMSRLDEEWNNAEDAIYDNWKQLYGV